MQLLPLHYHGCTSSCWQVLNTFACIVGTTGSRTEESQYTPRQQEELVQLQMDGHLPLLLGPDGVVGKASPQEQQQGPDPIYCKCSAISSQAQDKTITNANIRIYVYLPKAKQ